MISIIKKAALFFIVVSLLLVFIAPGLGALFLPLSVLVYVAVFIAGKFVRADEKPVTASAPTTAPQPKIKTATGAQPRATFNPAAVSPAPGATTERIVSGGTRAQWGANEGMYANAIAHYKTKCSQASSEQQKLHAESMVLGCEIYQRQKFHVLEVFDRGVEYFDPAQLTKIDGKDIFDYAGEVSKAAEQLPEQATPGQILVLKQNFDRLKFLNEEFMQVYPLPHQLA